MVSPKYLEYKDINPVEVICEDIDDLVPYIVYMPEAPKPEEIVNFGLKPKEQFFRREQVPIRVQQIDDMRPKDKEKPKDFRKRKQAAIERLPMEDKLWVNKQWDLRMYGQWQYINGKPTYIPPSYWYCLNVYHYDVGLPRYKDIDRRYWVISDMIVDPDPKCFGMIEFTRRRQGKSYRAGCKLLKNASQISQAMLGIQSKTEADAKTFFAKTIVRPWRRLPWYFSPKFNNSTRPIKQLNFYEPAVSGERAQHELYLDDLGIDELETFIELRTSTEGAFDGEKLAYYCRDEAGKTVEANVYECWGHTKYCLVDDEKRIVGKAIITTTVEEMEKKGGENFRKLWDDSSRRPEDLNKLGQTKSGLYPYFLPAYDGIVLDAYGNSLIEQGKEELHKEREGLLSSPEMLASHIRKFPWTIREAFRSVNTQCRFNQTIINTRLEQLHFGNPKLYTGRFLLSTPGDIHSEAYFERYNGDNGRFKVNWMPPHEESNRVEEHLIDGVRLIFPGNPEKGMVGADPFKYNTTKTNRKSLGTGYAFWNYDSYVDHPDSDEALWVTDDFIIQYGERPPTKEEYGWDLFAMCKYLGIKLFPEINVPFLWDFFRDNGMGGYLAFERDRKGQRSKTPGAQTVGDRIKDPLFSGVEHYIEKTGHRCPFADFLEDCLKVEYENLSPYDYFVGGAYSLYGKRQKQPRVRKQGRSSPKFFDKFTYNKK